MDLSRHLRRQFHKPGADLGPGADCPTIDQIAAAAHGDLPGEEVEAVARHAATCSWCGFQWARYRQAEAGAAPSRGRLGLVILVVLAALAGALVLTAGPPGAP